MRPIGSRRFWDVIEKNRALSKIEAQQLIDEGLDEHSHRYCECVYCAPELYELYESYDF